MRPGRERNFVRLLFLDPEVRGRYLEREDIVCTCVAFFGVAVLDAVDDPRLSELVADPSEHDADFRTWWASRNGDYQTFGTKTLVHPIAGEVTADGHLLRPLHDEQEIIRVITAAPGSRAREACVCSKATGIWRVPNNCEERVGLAVCERFGDDHEKSGEDEAEEADHTDRVCPGGVGGVEQSDSGD